MDTEDAAELQTGKKKGLKGEILMEETISVSTDCTIARTL